MKTASIVLNVGLLLFALVVLLTDGVPTEARFIALSLLVLLVPGFTALVLMRLQQLQTGRGSYVARIAAVCNLVLFGSTGWSFVTRFPSHPKEEGLVPFVILTLAAPLLSLFVLSRYFRRPSGVHTLTT